MRELYIFKINSALKLFEYETEKFFPIKHHIIRKQSKFFWRIFKFKCNEKGIT